MIKSMTAFGRSSKETPLGRLEVEIQSLNRRMLDIHVFLPKELSRFEIEVRKWIGEVICRGGVSVRVHLNKQVGTLSLEQLKELKISWGKIASELGYDPGSTITLSFLLEQIPFVTQFEDQSKEEQMKNLLKEGIEAALKELIAMKGKEGEALASDVMERLKTLNEQLESVEGRAQFSADKYRQKLMERMKEFQQANEEMDKRLVQEIALYAEKVDVSEEEARIKSHIEQFKELMNTSEKSIGKTLDFLTQELHREVNTISSKSADIKLTEITVAMKGEIEKMREQIQNIE